MELSSVDQAGGVKVGSLLVPHSYEPHRPRPSVSQIFNLTAFQIFLHEKRPLIIEGRAAFPFPLAHRYRPKESLLYARSTGAKLSRDLGTSNEVVIDYPAQKDIVCVEKVIRRFCFPASWMLRSDAKRVPRTEPVKVTSNMTPHTRLTTK
jgi:hypothetical protein